MPDCEVSFDILPTEILLHIFAFVPAKPLVRLRKVCRRWKQVIDAMISTDSFWLEHCSRDFSQVYKVAHYKSRVGMFLFNIYRSLTLWRHLSFAREIRDEFASASCVNDGIRGIQVLRHGIIAVHKQASIVYYDIETLEPCKRRAITGDYLEYAENEDIIIIRSYHLHLFVIRKTVHNPQQDATATFENVSLTLLVDREIYYVDLNNDIYVCKLENEKITSYFMKHSDEVIMCLSHTDQFNYLTFRRNIYSFKKKEAVLVCNLDDEPHLLHKLYQFNFLESVFWQVVLQWEYSRNTKIPEGPLQDILTVRVYGDVVLVGCGWGVFLIYYTPFTDGIFDLYNAVPVKQYNFTERSCPVLSNCPIIKVDALEAEDGHTILVAMQKKIAVLHFAHSFKRTVSMAMLPYSDVHRVKMLRVEDIRSQSV